MSSNISDIRMGVLEGCIFASAHRLDHSIHQASLHARDLLCRTSSLRGLRVRARGYCLAGSKECARDFLHDATGFRYTIEPRGVDVRTSLSSLESFSRMIGCCSSSSSLAWERKVVKARGMTSSNSCPRSTLVTSALWTSSLISACSSADTV